MPTIKIEALNIEPRIERSESDDEEPPMKEAEVEESPIVPNQKKPPKKQQEYVACPQCNKSMLLKTFKYYHSYKCRPATQQPTVVKHTSPEKMEVSFNEGFSRKDQRNDSIKRLISRAV